MNVKKIRIDIWYLIVVLLLINYQVVTILLNDNSIFKYMRDILLVGQLFLTMHFGKIKKIKDIYTLLVFVLIILLLNAFIKTPNLSVGIIFLRRYLYPIFALWLIISVRSLNKNDFDRYMVFLLRILGVLSVWGIIQAWILGDRFLIRLGYPLKVSTGTLRDSFYFGNLGIQRVVSTLANSNVYALILGISIILVIINGEFLLKKKKNRLCLFLICIAYLLTFSRANFLAIIIVVGIYLWRYIPRKIRNKVVYAVVALCVIYILGLILGNSYATKIWGWIYSTFTGNESSSAARVSIWNQAFQTVMNNPKGMGFGRVGSFAQLANISDFIHAENSYLAIAIDLGVIGTIIYVTFFICLIGYFKKHRNRFGKSGVAIIVYLMICFMFSNHIYDMEAVAYAYIMIGMLIKMLEYQNMEINENAILSSHL